MHTILLTRRLFPEAELLLERAFHRTRNHRLADGVITQLTDPVDARFMDRMPRLRVISQCAVGVDNIELDAARARGITVMNTPGVLTEAAADMTWALILAVARRVVEADRVCRAGAYKGWDLEYMLGREIAGGTLGIIGAGRIGTAVARRAEGFGMRVLYHGGSAPGAARKMTRASLPRLLQRSDVVSLHVPAAPATHHLIGARELALMKRTAILVNTSRGSTVDESALIDALRRRVIWGAGLDVFEREPAIPAALRRLGNVVLTPHVASATRQTRGAMALTAARNLVDFFRRRPDPGRVVTASLS
ncbi:MAG TPA: D-glycerate dehydrogenase [Patescibacteria group bacterium]|nr:D-glycerate dehydrogenase [Patescibacteria group bacterium]